MAILAANRKELVNNILSKVTSSISHDRPIKVEILNEFSSKFSSLSFVYILFDNSFK